jgi:NAD-reducing hydrogenase large subunit
MVMTRTITIDPVTRIEGHAKITIHLNTDGSVEAARFHVTEFRGFEKFCVGRSFTEMPGITARICGICPVSHLLASAKAGDRILGVEPPPPAVKLRRLMNWAQIVQSHALSFFHLSAPDLLLGMESDPATRNIVGLIQQYPEVARDGIRLRQFGQEVIQTLGGRKVHPAWAVPGGVREPLSAEGQAQMLAGVPSAIAIAERALDLIRDFNARFQPHANTFGDFPSLFMGLVGPNGELEHHDGLLRLVDSHGTIIEAGVPDEQYRTLIQEAVEPWTYLKFPYYKPLGYENYAGMYRVGPLARLNVCTIAGTPRADAELRLFRQLGQDGGVVTGSFYYHYARLIEILYALEKMEATLNDPEITDSHVRAIAGVNQRVGIGVSEAPRGTLFHEYHVDQNGILQQVNLLIATGQNNMAMNRTIQQIAAHTLDGNHLTEGMLNRIEHGIRAYDPCLSCSTHAIGKMPLQVQLLSADGTLLDERKRN